MAEDPVYATVEEFETVREDFRRVVREMEAMAPAEEVQRRVASLAERDLDLESIEAALRFRKQAMEGVIAETGCVGACGPAQKVQDSVLQLFRMLHARRIRVMYGYKLPAKTSVFSQVQGVGRPAASEQEE
jgi:hypothetical protein